MEIRGVKEKLNLEYPKLENVNDRSLKTCIPNGWLKLGITSIVFELIMKNKVFAINPSDIQVLGGDVAVVETITITSYINSGITFGTVIIFSISIIGFIITKLKLNKNTENKKIKKIKNIFKILAILSIVLFIIWVIIYIFL